MSNDRSSADRRQETRLKKRIPCEVIAQGQSQRAFVLDVSAHGLFVQTLKPLDPGAEIGIRLQLPDSKERVELRTVVARSRRAPAHLAAVTSPGVGLRITSAPSEYWEYLAGVMRQDSGAKPRAPEEPAAPKRPAASKQPVATKATPTPKPAEPEPLYRVRAQQTGGPRSRSLTVSATSREDAEVQALAELGADWKIIEIDSA